MISTDEISTLEEANTWRVVAEINLAALRHNLSRIRAFAPGVKILAMVKGNAYGHGMVTVASALRDVDYLGVVGLEAAVALRHSGVMQPIVLMNGFQSEAELEILLEYKIDSVIFDFIQIRQLESYFEENIKNKNNIKNFKPKLWLKIDTGMHRLGFQEAEVPEAYQRLKNLKDKDKDKDNKKYIEDIILMTHFAEADQEAAESVHRQFAKFLTLVSHYSELKSCANSGALLQYPMTQMDIIRPGLILYGVSPCYLKNKNNQNKDAAHLDLLPVMTLKSKIISLHRLEIGERVGYGSTWRALRPTNLAVVSVGYGDGYPQSAKEATPVLIRGQKAWLAGRVSMDTITVDVTDIPEVALGDEVILWGENLPIEGVVQAMGLSPYGVLTGVTSRVKIEVQKLDAP